MKPLLLILINITLFLPLFSFAQNIRPGEDGTIEAGQGFVPCEGASCGTCDIIVVANTGIKWLITISFLFFAVLAVKAGAELVISQGNAGALSKAKDAFTNAFIGLIIILVAWILVDTLLRKLLDGGEGDINGYGPWSQVTCTGQVDALTPDAENPYYEGDAEFVARVTASGDNVSTLSGADIAARVNAIQATPAVTLMVNAALTEMGITDRGMRNVYRALISQESSNCTRETSSVGAQGCAQFMIPTAREYDAKLENRFAGKSDDQVAQMLRNDDAYSIRMGARLFRDALAEHNGDVSLALAEYNGGPVANEPSVDCPGQRKWQCLIRGDGYAETRNYVANIRAIANAL